MVLSKTAFIAALAAVVNFEKIGARPIAGLTAPEGLKIIVIKLHPVKNRIADHDPIAVAAVHAVNGFFSVPLENLNIIAVWLFALNLHCFTRLQLC